MQNYINSLSGNPFVKMVIIAIVLDTVLGCCSTSTAYGGSVNNA